MEDLYSLYRTQFLTETKTYFTFMQQDILRAIIAHKRLEIDERKQVFPQRMLEERISLPQVCRSMQKRLKASSHGIIAEFKRRSPSKGWINQAAKVTEIIPQYCSAGAAAVSILTDETYFGGSLKDITRVRNLCDLPILRKDFIIEEYQLLQAKAVQADAILLIAAAITKEECRQLAYEAHQLGLEVLLELHSEQEIDHINDYVDIIGVNNRHLGTFHTDIAQSLRLINLLPTDRPLISESGISSASILLDLQQKGFSGFLIGEHFMRSDQPGLSLKHFIEETGL